MANLRNLALAALAVTGVAATQIPTPAEAQVTRQGSKYLMRFKWEAGKTYTYNVSSQMAVPGATRPQTTGASYSIRVLSVRNGTANVEMRTQGAGANSEPVKGTIDNRGRSTMSVQGMGSEFTTWPEKPITIGESWTQKMSGMMSSTITYRLAAVRNEGGRQVAILNMSGNVNIPQPSPQRGQPAQPAPKGTISGRMVVDVADGMVRTGNMDIKIEMSNQQGQRQTITGKTTITRR